MKGSQGNFMEIKWIALMFIVLFSGIFAGLSYQTYNDTQCRIYGMTFGYTVEQVEEICGKVKR